MNEFTEIAYEVGGHVGVVTIQRPEARTALTYTTYAELARLNQRGVHFVTIRRRGARLVQKILARPAGDWTRPVPS